MLTIHICVTDSRVKKRIANVLRLQFELKLLVTDSNIILIKHQNVLEMF